MQPPAAFPSPSPFKPKPAHIPNQEPFAYYVPFSVITEPPPKSKPRKERSGSPSTMNPPCTECGKRFSSDKALFGHMRCHPERVWRGIRPPPPLPSPASIPCTAEEYEAASILVSLANGRPPPKEVVIKGESQLSPVKKKKKKKRKLEKARRACCGVHKCEVCSREFSSGPALGGHMRRHWQGSIKNDDSSVSVSSHFAMDLNFLAPETRS